MDSQKIENLLNLSLAATAEERQKSIVMASATNAGDIWEIIVRYSGDLLSALEPHPEILAVVLYGGYAILTLPRTLIAPVSLLPEVEYIEMPKGLFVGIYQARSASCINPVYQPPLSLSGKGVLVGVIDSGIDISHPDFRNYDDTTRIAWLWDQTLSNENRPPEGYKMGAEYSAEDLDDLLASSAGPYPGYDVSGHGTAVTGLAAGNGRASDTRYAGIAPSSSIIAVKMRPVVERAFPRTSELMQGINYCIQKAIEMRMPIAINISFGNNYGSHDGTSLLETYIDQVVSLGQSSIIVATGNEGVSSRHTSGILENQQVKRIDLSVGSYEPTLNVQIWKAFADEMELSLQSPGGIKVGPIPQRLGPQRFFIGNTYILLYYGEAKPYSTRQEIYIEFLTANGYVEAGVWQLLLTGTNIKVGVYEMWLPSGDLLNQNTRFLTPSPTRTLTIPSSASKAISVGAYNSLTNTYADFSGRGGTEGGSYQKPDLVAPGVNLTAPVSPSGYGLVSGTSFAAPIVTGSVALMMEWGIVNENDPFMYAEKVKAYLKRGAVQLPGYTETPNPLTGFGALCLSKSIPL